MDSCFWVLGLSFFAIIHHAQHVRSQLYLFLDSVGLLWALVVHACGDHVTMRGSPVPFVFNQVLYWRWKVQACGTGMVTVLL